MREDDNFPFLYDACKGDEEAARLLDWVIGEMTAKYHHARNTVIKPPIEKRSDAVHDRLVALGFMSKFGVGSYDINFNRIDRARREWNTKARHKYKGG